MVYLYLHVLVLLVRLLFRDGRLDRNLIELNPLKDQLIKLVLLNILQVFKRKQDLVFDEHCYLYLCYDRVILFFEKTIDP